MTLFKKLSIGTLSAVLALSLAVQVSHAMPSSKFAFSTSDLTLIPQTTGTSGWVTVLSSPIKTPAAKELFVSGSLEAGLFTQTLVKSKNNKKDTSTASVSIQVRALIDGEPAPPGIVTYAARTQTLSATLEGSIAGCLSLITNPDGTQSIVLDENCVTPEEIELILSTLSAATFNFVATNVPVGDHMISLQARISSSTSVQEGSASAEGLVGKGTMIVETVRAAGHAATEVGAQEGAPAADAGAAPTQHGSTWGKLKKIYR
jgi:hypothetical protein